MNRFTSDDLPRARAILAAFRTAGAPQPDATRGKVTAHAEQERQRSPMGWPVPRERLAAQLQERLDGGSLPNQSGSSYCGCAAAGQHGGMDRRSFRSWQQRRVMDAASRRNDAYSGAAVVESEAARCRQARMRLRVISWGNEHHLVRDPTLGDIGDRFYGGYAVPRFGGRGRLAGLERFAVDGEIERLPLRPCPANDRSESSAARRREASG